MIEYVENAKKYMKTVSRNEIFINSIYIGLYAKNCKLLIEEKKEYQINRCLFSPNGCTGLAQFLPKSQQDFFVSVEKIFLMFKLKAKYNS